MTQRTCRALGFEPDLRHRTNDANVSLALVARGLAVTLLPELVLSGHPELARRKTGVERTIYAVTRAADEARPSTRALLEAVRAACQTGRP
jgi:DNA-binding transcriptional LysR family regulator